MIESLRATQARLCARREVRKQYKLLESELADYSTDADRFDIEAMLDRYPDDQTAEIRRMLARQAAFS